MNGWYSKERNDSGKRSIVFKPKEGLVDRPVQLPCGKCIGCRADQSLMWSIRAYHEAQLHNQNCFITLTYSDEYFPHDGKIDKRELQLFFKRLRKAIAPTKLRYIACGEYGDTTKRPHYHALIFGLDFRDLRSQKVTDSSYTHPVLTECWGKGICQIDPVTLGSIMYVCGYVNKKLSDEDTFSLMSRRPGIGKLWLDKYLPELKKVGSVIMEGREFPIPARYMDWEEHELEAVKKARVRYALNKSAKHDPVENRRRLDAKISNIKNRQKQKDEKL